MTTHYGPIQLSIGEAQVIIAAIETWEHLCKSPPRRDPINWAEERARYSIVASQLDAIRGRLLNFYGSRFSPIGGGAFEIEPAALFDKGSLVLNAYEPECDTDINGELCEVWESAEGIRYSVHYTPFSIFKSMTQPNIPSPEQPQ